MLVDVILPLAIADAYTYNVPDQIECPQIGMRVLVPLARKTMTGIVLRQRTEPIEDGVVLRDILEVMDAAPIVSNIQLQLWQWIADYYMCTIGEVMAAALPQKALDRHYIFANKKRRVRLPEYVADEPIHTLSEAQKAAHDDILQQMQEKDIVLLHGVTSSGKTEIYTHLIRQQLKAGRQVLYLVPEIALTTQLTDRLQHIFGDQLYVYHSRVTDAQRMEIYRRISGVDVVEDSPARLIVGARSAIFLPMRQLGLIIVDEEHEPSYKQQDPAPRYHARSAAMMLARYHGAKVLLGTATPSVETYYNALIGKYGLTTLAERYAGLQLPHITIIDLQRQYHRKEMMGHFSDPLVEQIREQLAKGKQVILFQNRRGYAPYTQCVQCGQPPRCENCDVSLTVHMRTRQLICHHCGFTTTLTEHCPHCGGEMRIHGFGTERLEEEVERLFPGARIGRMDLDTTRQKSAYEDIIRSFSNHELDILIGTQMVSKGLHFDEVSLVAVLNADSLMNQPDFRSYERAYQMLEQVAGRAGRKGSQGEVIIQTFDPENSLFGHLKEHQYTLFYEQQVAERQLFNYPPFHRQIVLTLRHRDATRLQAAATALQQRLSQAFGKRCTGILTPGVARVQNMYIRQIALRIEASANFSLARRLAGEQIKAVESLPQCKGIMILPDVDPL